MRNPISPLFPHLCASASVLPNFEKLKTVKFLLSTLLYSRLRTDSMPVSSGPNQSCDASVGST